MYGESGTALRREVTALLELHRIQRKFGPADHLAQHVLLIQRYRENVLAWCANGLQVAVPMSFSNLPPRNPNPFEPDGTHSAVRDLARELVHARQTSTTGPASLRHLTTSHQNELVERWRQAARAAALAEGDIYEIDRQRITSQQAAGVVSDVAAITQAVVVLDRRYHRVPGWRTMGNGASLGWAALATALDANLNAPDFSLDAAGWRPRVRPMHGRVAPGLLGVLQAEHNVLAGLAHVPHALRLRLVVESQRVLSSRLSLFAQRTDPKCSEYWEARTRTYADIQRHLRDIGSVGGGGQRAAAEAANVVARLKSVEASTIVEPRMLAGFRMLAERIDERISAVVEEGVARGDFVQRVTLPRLDTNGGQLVQPTRSRYRPVRDAGDLALIQVVRQQLCAHHTGASRAPDPSRVELHGALGSTPRRSTTSGLLQP